MDGECPICQSSLSEGETVSVCPSSHVFHKLCIESWCQRDPSNEDYVRCPTCRQPLALDGVECRKRRRVEDDEDDRRRAREAVQVLMDEAQLAMMRLYMYAMRHIPELGVVGLIGPMVSATLQLMLGPTWEVSFTDFGTDIAEDEVRDRLSELEPWQRFSMLVRLRLGVCAFDEDLDHGFNDVIDGMRYERDEETGITVSFEDDLDAARDIVRYWGQTEALERCAMDVGVFNRFEALASLTATSLRGVIGQDARDRELLNQRNSYGWTPLMIAAICPRVPTNVVRLLLDAGANPDRGFDDHDNGRVFLSTIGNQGFLLGVPPSQPGFDSARTALFFLTWLPHNDQERARADEVARLLVQHGANVQRCLDILTDNSPTTQRQWLESLLPRPSESDL